MQCRVLAVVKAHKEERACNSIDILDVTKNRFQIAFLVEWSIRALERTMQYTTFTLWWEKLLWTSAQDAVYNAPPCTCSIQGGASVVSHNTQHDGSFCCSRQRATPDSGEWPCWRIHRYFSHICCTAVGVLRLAVGHQTLHVLVALHCNNTRKLSPTLVNVYSHEHPDALFLVMSRISMSIGRVSGVACPLLFMCPCCNGIHTCMCTLFTNAIPASFWFLGNLFITCLCPFYDTFAVHCINYMCMVYVNSSPHNEMTSNGEPVLSSAEKHCGARVQFSKIETAGAVPQKNSCLFVLVSFHANRFRC